MMKRFRYVTMALACCMLANVLSAQEKRRVLFLGNSYTASNALPKVLADAALSAGDTVIFQGNAPGGYTLQGHAANSTSQFMIRNGNWDFVVLQEQSQLPSFPIAGVEAEVFPYARYLDSVIHATNPCAQTIFYMTWGRKNGDAENCAAWPPVCTYLGMDSLLQLRYRMMADSNKALLSPVGAVWRYIRTHYPDINLYISDNSHPSQAGTYAAACSFYASIFRKNPEAITYSFNLPADVVTRIRIAARAVVYDSLLYWNIGRYDAHAAFTFTPAGHNTIQFRDLSENTTGGKWYFGDGDSSDDAEPVHMYARGGTYNVIRIVQNCFSSDTITSLVTACPPGYPACDTIRSFSVYPNPVSDRIWLDAPLRSEVRIVNAAGQLMTPVFTMNAEKKWVDVSSWPPGMYIVLFRSAGALITRKLIRR